MIQEGATLQIHGFESGGMIDELHLLSENQTPQHISITADNGTLSIVNTIITSWDTNTDSPDENYENGRAYIRARSRVNDAGTVQTSQLNIDQSTLEFLGFDASESYGVSMKAIRPDGLIPEGLYVYGSITDSFFRHNYYGIYLYRALDTLVEGNYVGENVEYGIDLHHDCMNVVISNNHSSQNGTHGIICSDGCSGITVQENESFNNGGHGIMFHISVNDSQILDNYVHDNVGSGIELFDSHRNLVTGNRIDNNRDGIRISVGSSENVVSNNTFDSNQSRAIYVYIGNDNSLTGNNRPHDNTISSNTITRHTSDEPIRLTDGLLTENTVESNTITP
jgi:parallel beta-helix repeat protein